MYFGRRSKRKKRKERFREDEFGIVIPDAGE
jgi:hypothetical protein